MNLIFITLSNINDISQRGIYADLMRKFRDEGHHVYIVSPCERRFEPHTEITESTEKLRDEKTHTDSTDHTDSYIGRYAQNYNKNDIKKYTDSTDKKSWLMEVDGVHILKVRTLNIQKTNVVEKGIGTLMIESQYKKAIRKHLGDVQFDLILYSTPPITFTNVVKFLKKRNPKAISYLLLKDIFPQNAVDIGLFGEHSLFNWWFRRKEVALYKASDFIGCMSPANVEFIRKHNTFYPADRVEVAPNSISLTLSHSPKGEGSLKGKKNDIQNVLKEFGMMRFARGVMWVMQEVFALERSYMICEPLESEGRFILSEVMAGGNFGHHDERLSHDGGKLGTMKAVCRHNWHLMSHYPSDGFWAPLWFVWHKCWKMSRKDPL